jgi:hypothetical protein
VKDNFDLLSLNISLWRPKPEREEATSFVRHALWYPSNESIDFTSRRVLLHETLHFWQLLAFPYLQHLVNEEWQRFIYYLADREVLPVGPALQRARKREQSGDFSAWDLLEGLTRYWEINSQSPIELLRQEAVAVDDPGLLEKLDPKLPTYRFPWLAIELAMRRGLTCEHYGVPYRWCLTRIREGMKLTNDEIRSIASCPSRSIPPDHASPSYAASVLFPTVASLSLGTDDPVRWFKDTILDMAKEGFMYQFNLNMTRIHDSVIGPILYFDEVLKFMLDRGLVSARSSPHSWDDSPTLNVPPYRWCAGGTRHFLRILPMVQEDYNDELAHVLKDFVDRYGLTGAMVFMGVREIRQTLASVCPPPRVRFPDGTIFHSLPNTELDIDNYPSFRERSEMLDGVTAAAAFFRRAEKAVSLGLPPDSFDP